MRADRIAKINRDGSAGPGGPVRINPDNQHTWKTMRLGKIVEGPGAEKGQNRFDPSGTLAGVVDRTPSALSVQELQVSLNPMSWPACEAIPTRGLGVSEGFTLLGNTLGAA